MAPEALDFTKKTLSAGGRPTKIRNLLLEKFDSHLISRHADEWKDVVYYLCGLQNDENNVFKVLHDADEEVAAIFVQLHTVMLGSFFSRQMGLYPSISFLWRG
ncbi:hypothetical protein OUZ56_012481 [Daphnia magna]|uniref:Uncharacterized protein n=1 Tax=Daphnia magna TaxID=35525 RepID=A0ABQ9Z354_9CRUS|nr:hypothetical protein OUZ56_012481 [Daphnia magna]